MADAVPGRVGIKFCQSCLRKDTRNVADIYCEDCSEYQCKECEKVHQLFPVMSKHKLVSADKAGDVRSKYDMKGLDQCKEHQKLMEFFCEDENMPSCGKCAVVSHRKCHHVVEIERTKELNNLDLLNIQRDFLEIEDKFEKIVHHLETTKDKLFKDALEITDKIQTMQDKVNAMFENLKQSVSKDIEKFQKQAFDDIDTTIALGDRCTADLKHTLAEIQAVSEQGSPVQRLIMAQNFKVEGADLTTQAESLSVGLKDFVLKFDFDDSLKLPPATHAMPGKLTMNYTTAPEFASSLMVSRQKKQKVSLKLLAYIDLKEGEGDVKEPWLTGLDFLSDGRLVAVDNKNKTCVVFDQNLERLNAFRLSKNPQDLVVVSEDKVAITTSNEYKLIFLKITKQNEITVVSECRVKKEVESISLIRNDLMLVGCIDDPQPVRVVSLRGEERELGIQFPTKTYHRSSSACTYIRRHNKVVFSDRYAHTVYIFDKATNARVEVKDEKIIKEPRGMAVGPFDSFFVCSENTHAGISYRTDIVVACVGDEMSK